MSIVLDVAIGVTFLYLLLALLVTTTQELVASVLGWRSWNLYDAIERMLTGTFTLPASTAKQTNEPLDLVTQLYRHPLIRNLAEEPAKLKAVVTTRALSWTAKRRLPSYIPSKTFALALLDILRGPDAAAKSATDILLSAQQTIDRIDDDDLKRALSLFVETATTKVEDAEKQAERIRERIEGWFNDRMARASGWYKRKAQLWSMIFATVIVVGFNADTLHVGSRLWKDGALRDSVVAAAAAFKPLSTGESGDAKAQANSLAKEAEAIRNAGFPVGWQWLDGGICARQAEPATTAAPQCWRPRAWIDRPLLVLGWLISILAVSLGSNFWFDVLGKALQLRGSGPKVSASTGAVETRKQ
jgi:hypothetical protein